MLERLHKGRGRTGRRRLNTLGVEVISAQVKRIRGRGSQSQERETHRGRKWGYEKRGEVINTK